MNASKQSRTTRLITARLILVSLLFILILVSTSSAEISKLKAETLQNGVIRISFTIDNESTENSYTLLREGLIQKQGLITAVPYFDIFDDTNTQNKQEYNYTLEVRDRSNNVLYGRFILISADSDYPMIISERKILSKLNTLTLRTTENSFCKAGVSVTQLFPMDGKEKIHSLKMGLVDGLNMIFVICEDSSGNMMPNPKIIEYTYDSAAPGQIKDIDVLNYIPKRAILNWAQARDANGIKEYRVYKRMLGSDHDEFIATTNMTTFTDFNNLREGQTYLYSVSAVDNADNEGSKSDPKNVTIYNTDLPLDVPGNYTTKTGNVTITGKAIANSQVTARMDSQVYETTSDYNGNFAFKIFTERSRTVTIEAFDENGNSKIAIISITRLAPDTEVQRTIQVREEKTNLTYIFLIAFLFFAIVFIIIISTKSRTLYGEIDSYMRNRRKKE